MRGTKRFAASSLLTGDSNQSSRLIGGSPFDSQRAESSQQLSVATPQLDMQRAESSRQHVRALNTQFASWVQTQLQNHPDELWEDGAQDYLRHASSIMGKFSDVVNWLKMNAAKGETASLLGFQSAPKTLASENKENNITSALDKSSIPAANASSSFGELFNNKPPFSSALDKSSIPAANASSSLGALFNNKPPFSSALDKSSIPAANASSSFGALFNNKPPFSFGLQTQSAVTTNNETSNDADAVEDGEIEQPSSPSVKKTEEAGVTVVHEVKCKLYVKSSDPADKDAWKDKGTGQLSIRCKDGASKGTRESKPNVVIRNDVGRVMLNALLYPGIKTNLQKNSIVSIFHTSDGENSSSVVAQTCLIRLKSVEERDKLAEIIQEFAPSS